MIRLKTNVLLSRPKPVFENNPDIGFVSAFYAKQDKPLTLWEKSDGLGNIRRTEEDESSIQLIGPCSSSERTKLSTPIRPFTTLGVKLPYMVIALKFINRACGFDVQIEDNQKIRRRFQFWTKYSTTRRRPFTALIPLYLHQGWNEIFLDLPAITKKLYGTSYIETVRIQIYPSCRLRMIYFARIPMHLSRALAIMGILLEEGKNAVDLQKLVKSENDNNALGLVTGALTAIEGTPAGLVQVGLDKNENKTVEKAAAPAVESKNRPNAPTAVAGNGNETKPKPQPSAPASVAANGNGSKSKPNTSTADTGNANQTKPQSNSSADDNPAKPAESEKEPQGPAVSSPQLFDATKDEYISSAVPPAGEYQAISLASFTNSGRKVAVKPFKLTLLQEYRNQLEILSKSGAQGLNQGANGLPNLGGPRLRAVEVGGARSRSKSRPNSAASTLSITNGNRPAVKDESQKLKSPSPPPSPPPTAAAAGATPSSESNRVTFLKLRRDSLGTINNAGQNLPSATPNP